MDVPAPLDGIHIGEDVVSRRVTHWRGGRMICRWVAAVGPSIFYIGEGGLTLLLQAATPGIASIDRANTGLSPGIAQEARWHLNRHGI